MALGAAALLTGIGLVVGAPPTPPASALLNPAPSIVIDGNTIGVNNDWDSLPPNLLDSDTTADACGSGVLDPTQLDGKLDALDVNNPNPTPGNVVNKGDFCRVWRAVEAVPGAGGNLDIVLYGAWQRYFANGEVTGYWPILGPDATSKSDDYLIAFEYESSSSGTVELLRWTGSTWASTGTLPAAVFEFALDDPSRPLFGEFALNLSKAGLWPPSGNGQCTAYSSDYVFSRTGNSQNAELQDYVGLAPYPISPCGELVVRKATLPDAPDPAVTFGYTLSRDSSSTPIAEGELAVPTAPSDTIAPIPGGTDYTLSEAAPPAGWTLQSIDCTVLNPTTGEEQTISSGTSPLTAITVTPGYTTECMITNVGPPTLTIIKQTIPEDPGGMTVFQFDASVTRTGATVDDSAFSLVDGASESIPVLAGDEVVVTELVPVDWLLQSLQCVGDDEWTSATASATLQVDQGEQIVCVFVNSQDEAPPTQAYLIVRKVAEGTDGTTGFHFTVTPSTGPVPASFTLTPPSPRLQVVTVTPAPAQDGTAYTVTETVPSGWLLTGRTCLTSAPGSGVEADPTGITVTLAPGQIAVCTFTNEPTPPALARLTVIKSTAPSGGTGFSFILRGPQRLPAFFTLDDGGIRSFDDSEPVLEPGTYTVTEDVPLGWAATGSCDDGTDVDDGRVTVDLEAGDDVTCTFTNTKQVSLTITKVAQPQSPQDFAFSVGLNKIAPVQFLLDDDGDPTDDPDNGQLPNTITGSDLPPGFYTVSETPVAGWELTSLSCTRTPTVPPADTSRPPVALIDLNPGDSAACTYSNTKFVTPSPSPSPTPSATPTPTPRPTPTPHAAHRGTHDRTHRRGVGEGFDRCPVRDWAR